MMADMVMEVDKDVGLDFLGAGNWLGLEAITSKEQTTMELYRDDHGAHGSAGNRDRGFAIQP